MSFTYEYPRPALTVDAVIFGVDDEGLKVLLIRRRDDPHKGKFALPGGFVNMDEDVTTAAHRELLEETGLHVRFLEEFATFSDVNRDPRERVVSVAHCGLVTPSAVQGGDDAESAQWVLVRDLLLFGTLAFDHDKIIREAHGWLQKRLQYRPVGRHMLPDLFPLVALQRIYEEVLGKKLDTTNFRRKVLAWRILDSTDQFVRMNGRPARLYSFNPVAYQQATIEGLGRNALS